MNPIINGVCVGFFMFILGIWLTIRQFSKRNVWTMTLLSVATPFLFALAFVRLIFLLITGKKSLHPCPPRLRRAEELVEAKRQQMFGGVERLPALSRSWQAAYEQELRRGAERVEKFARRYLHPHAV